ncbi:ABC-2 family transporter protein [Clostridium acetireducens DSM 10703]|jgi:lantibiotic protection ABC transporter MutE/EpiE family permease subunit|uniref:ABC-2 family transporter protein n=1 Tax=Clostridium acetireducens DSM 10703 TaxID=1121290 RepID=A0A1E8EZS8_9CLOT|nr:lantibiotic immunity ABC transporter MutE/EpiE family permease subunit [Clostridium acetireducens]OFI06670.1 ABC-2 family transporter protein [Clostridium acetireducens DSM 10703]
MVSYFISENMKIKRKFVKRLVWIAPIMVILLSVFLTSNYFQVSIYNWWYTSILPGVIAIEGCFLYKIDGFMKNKSIMALPVDLKKVWIAKILVAVKNIVISCMIIFIAGQLSVFVIPMRSESNISMLSGFIGILVMIITSIWQIPLWFFLGNKIGILPTIILSFATNIFSTVIAVKKFWWINPFSYTSRLMCPILRILPNGLLAKEGSITFTPELLNTSSIPLGIGVSIVLFIVITYLTAKWYERQEVK